MGLDAISYNKLVPSPKHAVDEDGNPVGRAVRFDANHNDFVRHAEDLDLASIYTFDTAVSGWSGSYGGYNRWREKLAEFAGYPAIDGQGGASHARTVWVRGDAGDMSGPFAWLIHFSDCEGTIGPAACAKLAADFAEHQAKADAHPDVQFRHGYATWRATFEHAAAGGAVGFH